MIVFFLKLLGGGLLVLCGWGIGLMTANRKRNIARSIADFERFLQYVSEAIRFRSLPGAAILTMAAQHPEYAGFCSGCATTFSQIQPPDCLAAACGAELQEGLRTLETATRQTACDTLAHLSELCRHAGRQAQETALHAQQLYPRMGACLGLLTAIVLS